MPAAAGPSRVSRTDLIAHLVAARIAGQVNTTRENNLDNYRRLSERQPLYLLGLSLDGAWTQADVLRLMAKRCGVSPDPAHTRGQDTIDPERTVERLNAMAGRLRLAADRRERVAVATGHPVGMRPVHTAIADALRRAGCELLTGAAADWQHPSDAAYLNQRGTIRYTDGVAMFCDPSGRLSHTHSPLPMRAILADLAAAGQAPPDLVVADHGWAGAAGEAGIDSVGFADCNDPALFVGEAEGRMLVTVPLDDEVAPDLYAPLTAYLLERAGLDGVAG
jgi:hypothetical protein